MPAELPVHEAFKIDFADGPQPYLISTIGDLHLWIGTCPSAQTLEAWSNFYKTTVWIPLPCKKWSCRHCAVKKIRDLARKTQGAAPNRLLTLTVDPSKWDTPREAFDGTRRQVPELIRQLRSQFGEFEYLRVTELTRGGWPHYHLLVRSSYIPHAKVKAIWQQLTGAIIVDLRQVKDTFRAYEYLVKYLTKMHEIAWTERHVSYSKGFFLPPEPVAQNELELVEHKIIEAHPATYLFTLFRHQNLVAIGYNVFTLDHECRFSGQDPPEPWLRDKTSTTETPATSSPSKTFEQRSLFPSDSTLKATPRTDDSSAKSSTP